MVSTSIIALILAGPPSPAPDFADRLDHVELAHDDSDFQFIGYDREGSPIGTIALWTDERGAIHLESDYEDSSVVVLDGIDHSDATLPRAVIAELAPASSW